MKTRHITVLLLSATLLTGCGFGQSKWNPLNWFGGSTEQVVYAPEDLPPLIPTRKEVKIIDQRQLIATVSEMRVERTPSGAIVRATGVAAQQGSYNAELVQIVSDRASTLVFAFRVAQAPDFQRVGSAATREVTVATDLSLDELAGIRTIVVQAAQNARSSRR